MSRDSFPDHPAAGRIPETSLLRQLRHPRSLAEVAKLLGCSKSHLSEIERGLHLPSRDLLDRLEALYGVKGVAPPARERVRGRPNLRHSGQEIRRVFGTRSRTWQVQPLRHEFVLATYHQVGRTRLDELDSQRRPRPFWKAVKTMPRRMNSPEQGALLALLLPDGDVLELEPRDVAVPLPIVHPPGHWWLAVHIREGVDHFVFFGQLEVCPRPSTVRRVDFLAGVRTSGTRAFVVVEIDGPVHQVRGRADRLREAEVALPFVRFKAEDVWRRTFRQELLARVREAAAGG